MQISRICGRKGTDFLWIAQVFYQLFLLNVHTCLNQVNNEQAIGYQ